MPEFDLESARPRRAPEPVLAVVADGGWLDQLRAEFDGYYARLKTFSSLEPDEVMAEVSAVAARLTEVRATLLRDRGQRANRLRLDEVDPLLEQLDFQFKVHSRIQATREMDFRMSGGQT